MKTPRPVSTAGRVIGTFVAGVVSFVASHALLVTAPAASGHEPIPPGAALLLVLALHTGVVVWLVRHAGQDGRALAVRLGLLIFGVQTFMPQTESVLFQAFPGFARQLPAVMVPRLFAAGLLHAALWATLAVAILGRWRSAPSPPAREPAVRPRAWAFAVAAVLYALLYFTFGYYVAWRSPAVRAYYEGTDPGTFWAQMASVLRDTPWLVPAQVVRGLLWAGLVLLLLRMVAGPPWQKALASGAVLAVLMCGGLLLPNPYMPFDVRMVHLAETASSNFLFGLAAARLLGR